MSCSRTINIGTRILARLTLVRLDVSKGMSRRPTLPRLSTAEHAQFKPREALFKGTRVASPVQSLCQRLSRQEGVLAGTRDA